MFLVASHSLRLIRINCNLRMNIGLRFNLSFGCLNLLFAPNLIEQLARMAHYPACLGNASQDSPANCGNGSSCRATLYFIDVLFFRLNKIVIAISILTSGGNATTPTAKSIRLMPYNTTQDFEEPTSTQPSPPRQCQAGSLPPARTAGQV